MPFKPGNNANPKGRPRGTRDRITHLLLTKISDDFAQNGEQAIVKVRETDPSAYLRVVASLIPKEAELTVTRVDAAQMSDDELATIARGSGDGDNQTALDKTQLN